ncbi:MAG: phosphoglyceromutase [Candidatus Nanopelagicaceae bacterium]|jgi:2,3-bisphosphoglycerate-dependent phosphoglycerate mutase|nr:phosphoglyceromutase [Candidatus Nanopelagicaceae bacterium]MDP5046292.1 phosphoglyceromutase [Candidatus Nanopelagicaceae bacterium]
MSIGKLILLRHGQSDWNAKNLFTGWVDVALSSQGEAEAKRAGELLKEKNLLPDVLHTSLLTRAIHTAEIALGACERKWIPVSRSWRLNERHYGALQGKDKAATLKEYGQEQFKLWRRSFDTPPPAIADSDQYSQASDVRYKDLGPDLPKTECLKDVVKRLMPYLDNEIANDLRQAKTVLVVAHGNSIRAIVKHLACISDSDIAEVNIPTGIPLLYRFDDDFEPIIKEGEYLDPEAAKESIAAVANQGK